jgi:hypothetical protein
LRVFHVEIDRPVDPLSTEESYGRRPGEMAPEHVVHVRLAFEPVREAFDDELRRNTVVS